MTNPESVQYSVQYIVLYGSLMSPYPTLQNLGLARKLELLGPCRFRGRLYDLGEYPGVIASDGENDFVEAELFRFTDSVVLQVLDEFEDYHPGNAQGSLYLRRKVVPESPAREAWVYLYNQSVIESDYIESGSWQKYLAEKNTQR